MNDGVGSCLSTRADSICGRPVREVRWQGTLVLLLVASLLLFVGLGRRSLWAAEGRWAEVTREMLLTGDFFHPTIGGEPYFDKPLLTYWFRAALCAVTGMLNELIVRLPSAFAGLAAVWATMRIGARLWSAQTGRIAGWLLLTMYAFLFWARTGTADAENLAAIMLAVAWYWHRRDRLTFSALLVFYLIAFVGALTKGLTAVAVPVLVVLPDLLVERRWRILFRIKHIGAVGIAALVYLTPFVYAALTRPGNYESSGLALVFQENILRFIRPIDHKGPIYLYLYELPILLLPWTPLFVLALIGVARYRKKLDGHTRWLAQAIALVFLFFTLSGSRRSYYILPILPLCALLMAVFVGWLREAGTDRLRQRGLDLQRTLLIGLGGFNLAVPLILVIAGRMLHFDAPLRFHVVSLGIGAAAIVLGVVLEKRARRSEFAQDESRIIQPWIAMAVVLLGGYFCWQQNLLEAGRTERPFAQRLRASIAGISPTRVGIFPKCNANILFYLGGREPVDVLASAEEVGSFMDGYRPGVLITQQRYAAGLPTEITARLLQMQDLCEQVQPWESKSSRKEKWVAWLCRTPGSAGIGMEMKEPVDDAK